MKRIFLIAALLLCAAPVLAGNVKTTPRIDTECAGCAECYCDRECLCPTYIKAPNGRKIYFAAKIKHPIYAAAYGTVTGVFGWLVPEPRRVLVPVEPALEVTPAQVVRGYRPAVK